MSTTRHLSIIFLAYSLELGGAERQLVNLTKGLSQRGHQVKIVVMKSGGILELECIENGIPILGLQRGSTQNILCSMIELVRILRLERPDILHSYLPVANVIALILFAISNVGALVWGVRSSFVDFTNYSVLVKWADKLQRILHFGCNKIFSNSEAGKYHLLSQGIPKDKIVVIPNGIDTRRFSINRPTGRIFRAKWGVSEDEILIGLVGRFDPMKDHETFLTAIAMLLKRLSQVRIVCVGGGGAVRMHKILETQESLNLNGKIIWAGEQEDMSSVMNALDMLCLSSKGEGFPNVLGEALACGVPCVSTDVGDAARIIGDRLAISPPENPLALMEVMAAMVLRIRAGGIDRKRLRQRIIDSYSIDALVKKTEANFIDLLPRQTRTEKNISGKKS